jgi:dipeptidyl-peptidase-3
VLQSSAINYYSGLTQAEVEAFYAARQTPNDVSPVSHGLNSRLAKIDGVPVEQVQKVGGRYTEAIERMVFWLEKALPVAENAPQREALAKLVEYYRSGKLEDWDDYNIAWVRDTESSVDLIHGFIEVYHDPLGMRGAFESVVAFRDPEATRRIDAIAAEAQWFEDRLPIFDRHKKADVTGITG